jgi:hypothetical protein
MLRSPGVEGGDEIFGVDIRADQVLLAELIARCGDRWPGKLVMEGFDQGSRRSRPDRWAVPLDPHASVAWAGYANEDVAADLRARLPPVR